MKTHKRIHTDEKPVTTTKIPILKKDTDINVRANEKFGKFIVPDILTEIKENSLKKQPQSLDLKIYRGEKTVVNQAVKNLDGHKILQAYWFPPSDQTTTE